MPATSRRLHVQFGVIAAVWFGIGLVATLQAYVFSALDGSLTGIWGAVQWQFIPWTAWALITPIALYLGWRMPIGGDRWMRALLFHFAVGTVMTLLHTAVALGISSAIFGAPPSFGQSFLGGMRSRYMLNFLIYWAILGSGLAVDYYRRFRERELAATHLEAQLASAQLHALKMQLHPHFLFNTLHAVGVLVEEHPAAARRMLSQLGDFLRHTIDTVRVQEVPLKEELEFLKLYLAIEQTRFADRLAVDFDIGRGTLDAVVPSFILQPLVENSIKHGISRHAGIGHIAISSSRSNGQLRLTIEDGGCERDIPPIAEWRDGVGLSTTRERLERLYGHDQQIAFERATTGVRATLTIPFDDDLIAAIDTVP